MEWIVANWWWLSWILNILVVPAILGALKVIAMKTKSVKDDKIITLLIEWWDVSKRLLKLSRK